MKPYRGPKTIHPSPSSEILPWWINQPQVHCTKYMFISSLFKEGNFKMLYATVKTDRHNEGELYSNSK